MTKKIASLSLDLDNEWSYMKTHGDAGWDSYPSYLDIAVPRFLALFKQLGIKATVFVVGQDAVLPKNQKALSAITAAGHEIGNHSFSHEPWLHLYTPDQVEREIISAEDAIQKAAGTRPVGFRGPGYSLSVDVLRILASRGYIFDASTLPTFIGPLGRAYYFMTSRLDKSQREERKVLFGSVRDGLRPIDPYLWDVDGKTLLEIPVTTMPVSRMPFHISYLLYISRFSKTVARAYLHTALQLCRATGTRPSVLLHPLDLLGKEDIATLGFFPGMDMDARTKHDLVMSFLSLLQKYFTILSMGEYAKSVHNDGALVRRKFKP
jgi:peptidoglycan-N-acetylglucosamine deacetylase